MLSAHELVLPLYSGNITVYPNTHYTVANYLSVPGILNPPINLTIVNQGASHSRLFWEAPDSLDITDIEPDISNYRICTNLSGVCINTTEVEHIFPNVRIPIEFSVTAINIVGESNASITIYEPCDPSTRKKTMNARASVSYVAATNLELCNVFTGPERVNASDVRNIISFQGQDNPVVMISFPEVGVRFKLLYL